MVIWAEIHHSTITAFSEASQDDQKKMTELGLVKWQEKYAESSKLAKKVWGLLTLKFEFAWKLHMGTYDCIYH